MVTTLVLGGARSGKSRYAQREAEEAAGADNMLTMVVTAQALDKEMDERIAAHRAARGDRWRVVEAPLDLSQAIAALHTTDIAVVDCLTLWLSNLVMEEADMEVAAALLLRALAACPARLWLVSNEVGWGIVPENALARRFRDMCGRLHQQVAARAQQVVMVVAGLPLIIK